MPQRVDGVTIGRVLSFRDVTTRAQEEQRRRELDEHRQHGQRMEALGTLAGGIAHDFNNLLTVILGRAELARDSIDNEALLHESLREISEAGSRASDLVRQIREFSQKHPADRTPVGVAAAIDHTVHLLREALPAGVELVTAIGPSGRRAGKCPAVAAGGHQPGRQRGARDGRRHRPRHAVGRVRAGRRGAGGAAHSAGGSLRVPHRGGHRLRDSAGSAAADLRAFLQHAAGRARDRARPGGGARHRPPARLGDHGGEHRRRRRHLPRVLPGDDPAGRSPITRRQRPWTARGREAIIVTCWSWTTNRGS